jgi:hypothetical protein
VRVRFPGYRRYKAGLVAANDAMMALLIGARLGEHSLSNSAASPGTHLPQIYGEIPGIERVNRTVADAARLLAEAEHHLASMGIPYVLGVHAAFVADATTLLREDGQDDAATPRSIAWRQDVSMIPLAELHDYFAERTGTPLPTNLLDLFSLARRIRNRIVHFAGNAGPRLQGEYRQLPRETRNSWERVAGRPLTVSPEGQLQLSAGELIAVLAFTRGLASSVNDALAESLSRPYWLGVIIDDYRTTSPQRFGEKSQRVRRISGFARTLYRPLGITSTEVERALEEEGSGGSSY